MARRRNGLGGEWLPGTCGWCSRPLRGAPKDSYCANREDCHEARERKGEVLEREMYPNG